MKTNKIDKSDFWAISEDGFYFHICEGTGDALSLEDQDEGYVDYIYYDYYATLGDIHEDNSWDGGMILLRQPYQDMSLEDIVARVEEFEDVKLGKALA